MKKLFSILLMLFLMCSLVGCAAKAAVQVVVPPVKSSNNNISTDMDQKATDQKIREQAAMLASLKQKQLEKEAADKLAAEEAAAKAAAEVAAKQASNKPTESKTVFLTFDDGPCIGTLPLLDILDKHNVKATFFVTGMHYPQVKGLYAEIKKRGHTIGLHTMTHNYGKVYTTVDGFFSDLQQIEDIVFAETGDKPKLLRFPGGSTNQSSWQFGGKTFMKEKLIPEVIKRGYVYFDWNSCGNDALAVSTKDYIIQSVFTGIQNKKDVVVLLHDSNYKWTMDALPEIIERFRSESYAFGTLSTTSFRSQFTQ